MIAEDLIVGAVLLDDEEDVLDAERGEIGDAAGGFELGTVGGDDLARSGRDLCGTGAGIFEQRAFILRGVEVCPSASSGVADALDVEDAQGAVVADDSAEGNQPVGMAPSTFQWRPLRVRTAIALLPPQAT